jgi:6-phosphogluconolactonase/glucosamine-6-phosphate isomerase/deaminase
MLFIKVKDPSEASAYLARELITNLNKDLRVIWLVSGGSNSEITAKVLGRLPKDKLKNLTLALVDERFGRVGHSNSNFTKLEQVGCDFSNIKFEPVLRDDNLTFEQTTNNYEQSIRILFEKSDIVVGQFGIGADGHTAGILPHSPATAIDERLVIGYQGPDYKRITLSFKSITMVDLAYIFAFGKDKDSALQLLHDQDQSLSEQPAQIFRQSDVKSFIINNMIGDEI